MGKFWRLLGKGLGWLVRNPEAIAGAKEMWGQLRKGPDRPDQPPVDRPQSGGGTIPFCASAHDGYICTLAADHPGPHIAVGTTPLVAWPR